MEAVIVIKMPCIYNLSHNGLVKHVLRLSLVGLEALSLVGKQTIKINSFGPKTILGAGIVSAKIYARMVIISILGAAKFNEAKSFFICPIK